jgi:hypothetical protein
MSGGGFEGKSNDIVYSDIVYSDIVYSDIVYSDNAEYNYGGLSELYNNIDSKPPPLMSIFEFISADS